MNGLFEKFTHSFIGSIPIGGEIRWHTSKCIAHGYDGECIKVCFAMHSYAKDRHAIRWAEKLVESQNINWLFFESGVWTLDFKKFYQFFDSEGKPEWAEGVVNPIVEVEQVERQSFQKQRKETSVKFIITRKEVLDSMSKKLFLSHKSIDKPIVRDYCQSLSLIGYDPWIDEDSMVAGQSLERTLLSGIKDSCAAIFFITPQYKDEDFLATEIDYAIAEKRAKKDRFSIITLVFEGANGEKGSVPDLLKQYVWKEPKTELEGLREIIRALPLSLRGVEWSKKI